MGVDVLAGDVRNKGTITVRISVENQGPLPPLIRGPEPLATEEQPKFQRHVKSRKVCNYIHCDGGQVVDSESAFLNDPLDFGQPKLPGIILFKGTARDESEIINTKDNSVEYRPAAGIKW